MPGNPFGLPMGHGPVLPPNGGWGGPMGCGNGGSWNTIHPIPAPTGNCGGSMGCGNGGSMGCGNGGSWNTIHPIPAPTPVRPPFVLGRGLAYMNVGKMLGQNPTQTSGGNHGLSGGGAPNGGIPGAGGGVTLNNPQIPTLGTDYGAVFKGIGSEAGAIGKTVLNDAGSAAQEVGNAVGDVLGAIF